MLKLDYELTEKMLKVSSLEDLQAMQTEGANFATASRLSIDEVLQKVFQKKCNANKDKAVEMLVALINGQEVESILDDEPGVKHEDNSPAAQMDPEVRIQKIKERMEVLVPNMSNYYEYCKKLIKDPELKMLGCSEDDLAYVAKDSTVAICGEGWQSHKKYLMKKTKENIEIALKEGDILHYNQDDPFFEGK